jgi:enoyl-CoA hydratase/carnithine racemase
MHYHTLLYEKAGNISTLILNRPDKLNALNLELFDELLVALRAINEDDEVRALILTGAGRAFCAGADLGMIQGLGKENFMPAFRRLIQKVQAVTNAIEGLDKPVIGAINGATIGGGLDIAIACDIRLASETAVFGEAFIRLGLVPDMGATFRLPRLVGIARAKEIILTGDTLSAVEAEKIGLVNKVLPANQLMEEAKKWAAKLAAGPPLAIKAAKQLINNAASTDLHSALADEMLAQCQLITTQDHQEGVKAFLEKRTPHFQGR